MSLSFVENVGFLEEWLEIRIGVIII